MSESLAAYRRLVTADPQDWGSLSAALDAHRRRRPRDGQIKTFVPNQWRVVAVRSRSYIVKARDDGRRAWGR